VSEARFATRNLSRHVGDDGEAVATNRAQVLSGLALAGIAWIQACHGSAVAVVDGPNDSDGLPAAPIVDGIITTRPGLALAGLAADCAIVLLAGTNSGGRPVVAAAHCGRPGLAEGILPSVVASVREFGAVNLRAVVGPTICASCYEVSEELRAVAAEAVPESWAETRSGRPAVDLASGVQAQLARAGVEDVLTVPGCTAEDPRLYSHRRDGKTGRHGGFVWFDEKEG
jgi:YfiH family protein